MRQDFGWLGFGIVLCLSVTPVLADDTAPKEDRVVRIAKSRFKEADEAFKKRRDADLARKCLKLYREFHEEAPADPATGWRLAMISYFVGIRLTDAKNDRIKLYDEGMTAGERSIRAAEQAGEACAPCYFWTAINTVLYHDTQSPVNVVLNWSGIRKKLERSIAIDPKFAHAGAYRLLGHLEWKIPGIMGASNERAREYFEKALEHAPDEPLNYFFMAQLYHDKFDDNAKALEYARKGLQVPKLSEDRIESRDALIDIRKFIEELEQE